jgi:Predicted membrane protein
LGGSTEYEEDAEIAAESARKNRNAVFIPVIVMAVSAIAIAMLIPESSASVIGIGAFIALFVALFIFRPSTQELLNESNRMVQQVGTTSILPQLLTALGLIFVEAGVGEIVARYD